MVHQLGAAHPGELAAGVGGAVDAGAHIGVGAGVGLAGAHPDAAVLGDRDAPDGQGRHVLPDRGPVPAAVGRLPHPEGLQEGGGDPPAPPLVVHPEFVDEHLGFLLGVAHLDPGHEPDRMVVPVTGDQEHMTGPGQEVPRPVVGHLVVEQMPGLDDRHGRGGRGDDPLRLLRVVLLHRLLLHAGSVDQTREPVVNGGRRARRRGYANTATGLGDATRPQPFDRSRWPRFLLRLAFERSRGRRVRPRSQGCTEVAWYFA